MCACVHARKCVQLQTLATPIKFKAKLIMVPHHVHAPETETENDLGVFQGYHSVVCMSVFRK